MTPRAFLTLAAATALAVAGAGWALVSEHFASTAQGASEEPLFPSLVQRGDDVSRVEVENRGYKLVLEKRGENWVAIGLGDYPAKAEPVAQVISGLARLRAYEPKTDNPEWYKEIDVTDVGPESNATLVTAIAANGDTLASVLLGKESRSIGFNPLGGTFIRQPGEAQAWLAEGAVFVPRFLQNWFDQIVHVPGPDIRRITVLEGDKVVFDSEKSDPSTGEYALLAVDEKYGPAGSTANSNNIKNMAQGIVSTSFDNARALDTVTFAPDARTVRFKTADEMELEVRLGTADGQTWVAYRATAPDGSAGATKAKEISDRTQNWAFLLPSYRVASLERPVPDLVVLPEKPAEQPLLGPGGVTDPSRVVVPGLPALEQR